MSCIIKNNDDRLSIEGFKLLNIVVSTKSKACPILSLLNLSLTPHAIRSILYEVLKLSNQFIITMLLKVIRYSGTHIQLSLFLSKEYL